MALTKANVAVCGLVTIPDNLACKAKAPNLLKPFMVGKNPVLLMSNNFGAKEPSPKNLLLLIMFINSCLFSGKYQAVSK